jgi:hypothetical protein
MKKYVVLCILFASCTKTQLSKSTILDGSLSGTQILAISKDTTLYGSGGNTFNLSIPKFNQPDSLVSVTIQTISHSKLKYTFQNNANQDHPDSMDIVRGDELQGQLFHDIHYLRSGFDMGIYVSAIETSYPGISIPANGSISDSVQFLNGSLIINDSVTNYLEAFRGSDSIPLAYTTSTGGQYHDNSDLLVTQVSDTTLFRITYYFIQKN